MGQNINETCGLTQLSEELEKSKREESKKLEKKNLKNISNTNMEGIKMRLSYS